MIILACISSLRTILNSPFKIIKLHLSQKVSKCYALIVYDQEVFSFVKPWLKQRNLQRSITVLSQSSCQKHELLSKAYDNDISLQTWSADMASSSACFIHSPDLFGHSLYPIKPQCHS